MAHLRTDSPISRCIVRAFLDFLDSVEAGAGVDAEGLEVARECLTEAFKLQSPSVDDRVEPGLLNNLFRSPEANEINHNIKSDRISHDSTDPPPPSSSYAAATPAPHLNQGKDWMRQPSAMGISEDELFGQFFAALEKIHFFNTTPDGNDDPVQLDKATRIFHDALNEMEKTGSQSYNLNALSETLKSQGNRVMQSKLYSDAIELYSCAISLCENNAVYYCNRAAAYTQMGKYTEAIRDCLKSIEIDPNYSKAYSRLGAVYFVQGNYRDAIDEGFKKALQLDPNNESAKENIQVAEQKIKESQQQKEQDRNASPSSYDQEFSNQSAEGLRSHGMPPPFPSMPFGSNSVPVDFASMFSNIASQAGSNSVPVDFASIFSNMASQAYMGEQCQDRQDFHNQSTGGSRSHGMPPPFTSMPMGNNANPVNFASVFSNMASQAAYMGEQGQGEDRNLNGTDGPEIRIDGNIGLDFPENENMPEELRGALQSLMGMFSGAATHGIPQGTADGRSSAN